MNGDITYPVRTWGNEEPAPPVVPLVLVSSRDGRGEPAGVLARSASWRAMRARAEASDWTVGLTYALAWINDQHYLNGKLAKAAHHVHSIALRMTRGVERALAVWHGHSLMPEPPGKGWRLDLCWINGRKVMSASLVESLGGRAA
jgi:hypothetical protein